MRFSSYRGENLTPILVLIIINFVVYLATTVAALTGHQLIPLLGFQAAGFFERPWTILTSLFVHGGLWHLAANMLTFFFFGRFFSGLAGTRALLTVYFLGGLAGNLFFMLMSSPFAIVIGASGAVFALGGALTVLTPRLPVIVFPIPVPLPLWAAVIGGFVLLSLFPGVAWQGHLGGMLTGIIAGFILRNRVRPLSY